MDSGNTAWILTSTALVLFMTLPGLALFYGGLVRSKNVLSVLMQCISIACLASVLWLAVGYSLAFGDGNQWIGDTSKVFLSGVGPRHPDTDKIPEGIEAQTHATFSNVIAILEAANLDMSNVVDIMVFLTDMKNDFKKFNSIYSEYIEGHEVTRTTVEVGALPTPISVEFKVVAKK